jgi:transposase InsO family protein
LAQKRLYPKRGAKTILVDLEDALGSENSLPSIPTLSRLFRGLPQTRAHEPNRPLITATIKAAEAHDLWQIDDMGAKEYPGLGHVGIINAKDVSSRVQTGISFKFYTHCREHPDTKDYVYMLRRAFREFGMPKGIQSDRGSIFKENQSKSPFPTHLHLWLVGLGINFQHAKPHRPTDQAVIERTHQTLHNQLHRTQDYESKGELVSEGRNIMDKLNYRIPCASLGSPPLVHNSDAIHSGRIFDNEKELYKVERVAFLLENMEWFRKVSNAKTFALGKQVYYHNYLKKGQQIKIRFDAETMKLNCYNDKELVAQVQIKGIAYEELTAFFDTIF